MLYQKIIIFILMLICFLLSADYYSGKEGGTEVIPQTNNSFPFQGYFTDSMKRPYFGSVYMGFIFWDRQTDGSPIYAGLVRKVIVYNGLYATKISLPEEVFAKFADKDDIWVEVCVFKVQSMSDAETKFNDGDPPIEYRLSPRVQLTAAPYAWGVRGLYYEGSNNTLKIGKAYQGNGSASNGLIISGNVGIGALDTSSAKLVVSGNMIVSNGGRIDITGELTAITANGGVSGAVWN